MDPSSVTSSWSGAGYLAFASTADTTDVIREGTRLAQNCFLEGLGLLRYLQAQSEREGSVSLRTLLEPDDLEDWHYNCRTIGCLVDPASLGYLNVPLLQLVEDNVPVHYSWGRLTAVAQPLSAGLQPFSRPAQDVRPKSLSPERRDPTCYLVQGPDASPQLVGFRGASAHTKKMLSAFAYEEGYADDEWPTRTYYAQTPSRGHVRSASRASDLQPELAKLVENSQALSLPDKAQIRIELPDVLANHGVWVLTPLAELKLRAAALLEGLCGPEAIVNYALQRGIPFRVEVPLRIVENRRFGEVAPEAPIWLTPGYRDIELPYLPSVRDMKAQYEAHVDSVLR
ncbi:hypothetical protein EIP86_009072 [Pleurotus ostreatoroseus]|nr:hypothetical protein EIP86_009072 [Pleurotus ostreatoroseus]